MPGIIIGAVIIVNISIVAYYEHTYPEEYKQTDFCCPGWDSGAKHDPLASVDPKISNAKDALIAVIENENLPGNIASLIAELKQANLTLSRLSVILQEIYAHYQFKVIPDVRANISYTGFNHYSDFRIFRQPPVRIQMVDDDIPLEPNEHTKLLG